MIKLHPPINQPMLSGAVNVQTLIQVILTLPPIDQISIIKAILQSSNSNLRQVYADLTSELETIFTVRDDEPLPETLGFGIWANDPTLSDSVEYVNQLRAADTRTLQEVVAELTSWQE